jgi:hypothetical protein
MSIDPAFVGAGKAVGFELWRVEKKTMVRQPEVINLSEHNTSFLLKLNFYLFRNICAYICRSTVNSLRVTHISCLGRL